MKKSFLKVGFMLALAMITTVSLSSCSSDADADGAGMDDDIGSLAAGGEVGSGDESDLGENTTFPTPKRIHFLDRIFLHFEALT